MGDETAMTLNLSRARKAAVTARSPTTFELHIQLLLLLHASFVFLFLDPDSETLSIANQLRPVDIAA